MQFLQFSKCFRSKRTSSRRSPSRRLSFDSLEDRRLLSTIDMTAAWFAQQGAVPYLLTSNNTTYVLETNITTPGTAFVVGGKNITLDLNGYTVTYGSGASPVVTNGGFESPYNNDGTVPGWNLSGAPNAVLAANTDYLFGNQVLRLANFSTAQTIISDPVAIPEADHTYTASIIPGDYGDPAGTTTLTISVIDTVTGQVLVSSDANNDVNRGIVTPVTFFATTTDPVEMEVVVNPNGSTTTVDLDDAAIMRSYDYGIVATNLWGTTTESSGGDFGPGYFNLSAAAQAAYGNAANFTLQNSAPAVNGKIAGGVFDGQANSYGSSCLLVSALSGGFTMNNVACSIQGMDAECVTANNVAGNLVIENSTFNLGLYTLSDRMNNYAAIDICNNAGNVTVVDNQILGSGQVGISLADTQGYQIAIEGNDISMQALVTNGYGITLNGIENFTIADNTITSEVNAPSLQAPSGSRGILLDGYDSDVTQDGNIYGNYVDVQEGNNREYNSGVDARALDMRNTTGPGVHLNIWVHNNTFIATTGTGLASTALGMRIDYENVNGAMDNAGIVIQGNLIEAFTDASNLTADAFLLDGADAGIDVKLIGNTFESNDVSLQICSASGTDAADDTQFISNTFMKSSQGAAMSYSSVCCGYWTYKCNNIQLIDSSYAGGATPAIDWVGSGSKELSVGWLLSPVVEGSSGTPLAGAAVQILNNAGVQVFSGTTNAGGQVETPLYTTSDPNAPSGLMNLEMSGAAVVTTTYTQTGTKNGIPVIATAAQGPFEVEVSLAGYTPSSQAVTISASQNLTIPLSDPQPSVPVVTGVSCTTGPTTGGTLVTITGTGFTGTTAVEFGTTAAGSFTVVSDTQITATAPAGTGAVYITVTNPQGTSTTSSAGQFTYVAAPAITGVSCTTGPAAGGTLVTITGTNFTGATAVYFGTVAAGSFTVVSATQITVTSPAGSGTVYVTVATAGGTSATSSAGQFAYLAAPVVTGVSCTSGPPAGGTSVTITGTGFSGATAVYFGTTAAGSFTVVSATQITVTSPAGSGTVYVTVVTAGGTSSTSSSDQFSYKVPAAVVTGVSSTKATGAYGVGTSISITVTFNEAVTVTGTPELKLNGGSSVMALYTGGSGTSTLTFTYTVAAGQNTSDLNYASTTALVLNSGSILNAAGSAAVLTLPATGSDGLAARNIVIDTKTPKVTGVSSTTAAGTYGAGTVISITLTFNEAVTVTGTPQLALNAGCGATAYYAGGSGTSTLTFTYTVAAGQKISDLNYTSTTALALDGGSIKDAAGNVAVLTLPGTASDGLKARNIVINTTA